MSEQSGSRQALQALATIAVAGAAFLIKQQLDRKRAKPAAPPPEPAKAFDAKAVYLQARAAEEQGDFARAEELYSTVARQYERLQQDSSVASISLAASLYQLGSRAASRGRHLEATNQFLRAAEVFRTVADTAEDRGATELAQRARSEAMKITELVKSLALHLNKNTGSVSPEHEKQLEWIRHLDAETARINLQWAQGLARI